MLLLLSVLPFHLPVKPSSLLKDTSNADFGRKWVCTPPRIYKVEPWQCLCCFKPLEFWDERGTFSVLKKHTVQSDKEFCDEWDQYRREGKTGDLEGPKPAWSGQGRLPGRVIPEISLKDMRTGQSVKYYSKKKFIVPTFEGTVVERPEPLGWWEEILLEAALSS